MSSRVVSPTPVPNGPIGPIIDVAVLSFDTFQGGLVDLFSSLRYLLVCSTTSVYLVEFVSLVPHIMGACHFGLVRKRHVLTTLIYDYLSLSEFEWSPFLWLWRTAKGCNSHTSPYHGAFVLVSRSVHQNQFLILCLHHVSECVWGGCVPAF